MGWQGHVPSPLDGRQGQERVGRPFCSSHASWKVELAL